MHRIEVIFRGVKLKQLKKMEGAGMNKNIDQMYKPV
ncbi:hypothetical protein SAMN05428947_11822 [Mucilaginibacter sp. OK283]|jgi:hypothetical protein|nr:hypothetical protein SAMN05428947_11822 [Mucilaginibacter sp. OK283]